MKRWLTWSAAGAVVVATSVAISGCCCSRVVSIAPAHGLPSPPVLVLPVPKPVEATSDTLTRIEMRNVLFHLDDDARLRVKRLDGSIHDVTGQHVVVLDDRRRLRLEIRSARIALSPAGLTRILNRYIFGYRGSPLRDLSVRIVGDQLEQSGVLHKGIDIPFTMRARLSATLGGLIRLHPTSMKICSLEGLKLIHALGLHLQQMMDLSGARGVHAEGDDLLLDPLASLPPPRIEGHLTAVRLAGGEVVQDFGEPDTLAASALAPPVVAPNYILMKGGTIRFGKLYMVQAELETVDADPADPFDFYLDYYDSQLVAGYHVTRADGSLVAWMPDFADLGTPRGRMALPLESARVPDTASAGR